MQSADMPDCSSLQGMDHSKMDMTDPVTQALMQQCMSQLHSGDHVQGMGHNDTSDQMKHNSQTMEHHDDATDKMHDDSAAMDHSTGHMH
ncbi:hypothetical protein ACQUQU_01660 [Thalassolituus sp. LLYu03]|uniref:hypothetical protein n=1 Tax=Thalassolituus sp. LLYu03 TaxID=3421656 RepID=UPI003D29089D